MDDKVEGGGFIMPFETTLIHFTHSAYACLPAIFQDLCSQLRKSANYLIKITGD